MDGERLLWLERRSQERGSCVRLGMPTRYSADLSFIAARLGLPWAAFVPIKLELHHHNATRGPANHTRLASTTLLQNLMLLNRSAL